MSREQDIANLRDFYYARYNHHLTDKEVEQIVERETGGKMLPESDYEVLPGSGGFEVLKPTWDAYRE